MPMRVDEGTIRVPLHIVEAVQRLEITAMALAKADPKDRDLVERYYQSLSFDRKQLYRYIQRALAPDLRTKFTHLRF